MHMWLHLSHVQSIERKLLLLGIPLTSAQELFSRHVHKTRLGQNDADTIANMSNILQDYSDALTTRVITKNDSLGTGESLFGL